MASLKSIAVEVEGASDLALISNQDDSVWLVVSFRWFDLASVLWWFLTPMTKRGTVKLHIAGGEVIRARIVRVASKHARLRGLSP